MDVDDDGTVSLDMVAKVIELIGVQQGGISSKQLNHIIDMLQKEEMMEVESKLEKSLLQHALTKRDQKESLPDTKNSGDDTDDTKDPATEEKPDDHTKHMFSDNRDRQDDAAPKK